jgi:hypothetical protein
VANSIGHVIDTWVHEVRRAEPRFVSAKWTNIDYDSKQIYSYGHHFPMARYMTGESGEWFLVNGDTYSHSTSNHQGHLRSAIRTSGVPSMIVPFSALTAAGIDLDTIRRVEVTRDTNEVIEYSTDDWDKLPRHMKYVTETRTEVGYRVESCRNGPRGSLETYAWEGGKLVHRDIHENDYPGTDHFTPFTSYSYDQVKRSPGDDGVYRWSRTVHHLGASLFTARYQSGTKPERHWRMKTDYEAMRKRDNADETHRVDWDNVIERRYYYTEDKPVYDTAYFLSAFDDQERNNGLYFLAQLHPAAMPTTVEEAFTSLKPGMVRFAEKMGVPVTRQGDVFAVPVDFTAADLKALGATRPGLGEQEQHYVDYMRKREHNVTRFPGMGKTENFVLGVNHTATDVMVLDGRTYARGTLRHKRPVQTWQGVVFTAEHRYQTMGDGKTWHQVVKNTVPTDRTFASRSWSIGGGVD